MSKVNREVREQIRGIMEQDEVHQVELARRMGTTKASVTGFLNPERDMKLGTLERIADALGHDLEVDLAPRAGGRKSAKS